MSPIVADRSRHAFPLKSFFVGVVVMVGKVESSSTLPIIQIVCRRPFQTRAPIKIFRCRHGRKGRESRIKFNSSNQLRLCAGDRPRQRFKSFHMSGHDADWLPIKIAHRRRPLQIIWKPGFKFNLSDHSDSEPQTVPDNVLRVSICQGHNAELLPIVITDGRHRYRSYGNQA